MTYEFVKNSVSKDQLREWLYDDCLTFRGIMNKYGFQERHISRLAKEYGFSYNSQARSLAQQKLPFHQDDKLRAEIINAYKNLNLSTVTLAEQYNCSSAAMKIFLQRAGVKLRDAHDIACYESRRKRDVRAAEKTDASGYKRVNSYNYNNREHRYVMEQILGRPLTSEEHVHHIDLDKSNNDPSNLYCFKNGSIHHLYHGYINHYEYIHPAEYVEQFQEKIEWLYSYDTLYDLYITQRLSCNKIGKMYPEICSRAAITKALKKLGIYDLRPPTINQVA